MELINEGLKAEWERLRADSRRLRADSRRLRADFLRMFASWGEDYVSTEEMETEDIETKDAEWGKILEESESEIAKKPCLKNVYDEFIREHVSLDSAVTYRLAKLLSNDLVNHSELLELFQGCFAENGDIREEIRHDLRAARVRCVPNRSYVETLLNSRGFLALQAHKVAHNIWSGPKKTHALFIQKRVSEVFAVNILPEEKIESSMLLDKATGSFDGETNTGKNVTIYHGKVCVCQNKALAKESPNHPANLVRKRLEVEDGYFHQEFYRDEKATAFGCQPHGAEISQDGSIKLVQADHGSTSSTQLPSPPFNYKASAPPGNVRDGDGQPVHYINDGASSSQARPSDKCCQLNFSSSANKFLPTAGKMIQPVDQGSANSTQLASPSWNNTATAAHGNIRGGNGKSLFYINDGASSSQSRRASRQNQLNPSSWANIFVPTGGQLIQSDGRDSTSSTQVASSPLSITACAANGTGRASASSGDIEDGTRQARRHTNGRAASSLVRPTNGQNKNKLSTLSKIFIPIAFALLVASSSIWYNASGSSLSAGARILLILAEVFGFNGLLLCLGGYFSPSGSDYAQWLTVVGCVAILCGYISIMCTQLL